MNPQEKQLNALIRLLDDPDHEVYGQVHEALLSFGPSAVAVLEASLREHNFESRFDTRVSHIIDEIQTEGIKEELLQWTQSDDKDLLSGVVIVSKHHDPNIDISYSGKKINFVLIMIFHPILGITSGTSISTVND